MKMRLTFFVNGDEAPVTCGWRCGDVSAYALLSSTPVELWDLGKISLQQKGVHSPSVTPGARRRCAGWDADLTLTET
jgi:hypothetical protein